MNVIMWECDNVLQAGYICVVLRVLREKNICAVTGSDIINLRREHPSHHEVASAREGDIFSINFTQRLSHDETASERISAGWAGEKCRGRRDCSGNPFARHEQKIGAESPETNIDKRNTADRPKKKKPPLT